MNEQLARAMVRERSGGRCEAPGCYEQATDWSHRVAKGRLGAYTPDNGLDLCRRHHSAAHHEHDAARRVGWFVRTGHAPSGAPVYMRTLNYLDAWVLLDPDGSVHWLDPIDRPVPSEALAILNAYGRPREDQPA